MIAYYLAGSFILAVIYFKIFDIRKGWKNALILGGVLLAFYLISRSYVDARKKNASEIVEFQKSRMVFNIPAQEIVELITQPFNEREEFFNKNGLIFFYEYDHMKCYRAPSPSRGLGSDKIFSYKNGLVYVLFKEPIDYLNFLDKFKKKPSDLKDPDGICKEIFELENDCYICTKELYAPAKGYSLLFTKGSPLKYKDR